MGTPVDMSEINRRANEHRSSSKIKVAMSGMQPIGATKDAFFVQGQMSAQTNGDSTSMIVIVAATVANQLPIMVHVYATPKATGAPPMQSATDYVSNILRKN